MNTIKMSIVTIILCCTFFATSALAQDTALKLTGFEGKVEVKIAPTGEWVDASIGQSLNIGDAIRTADNGLAMLQFPDNSSIALKPNTEVSVEELAWSDTARKAGLNMPMGELRVIIKSINTPSDFKVKTPTAICGARGTVFYILASEGETRVFVTEGAVDFTNPASGNSYVVVESMSAISEISGTVTEPRELTGEEKDQALAGWSGVIAETYVEPPAEGTPGANEPTDTEVNNFVTPENPAADNKGQQEGPVSPV